MKVVIFAGGMGSRLGEETQLRPKPMVEIGGKPILWHIMKFYSHYGFNEFVILLGYKGEIIKQYFADYFLNSSEMTVDVLKNKIDFHCPITEPWKVTLLDTGLHATTGERLLKAKKYVGDQTFMLTYGDGVSDIPLPELLAFHSAHKKTITVTAVRPEGRFGALKIDGQGKVMEFKEKIEADEGWINGGFFVCEPGVFEAVDAENSGMFERGPLEKLSRAGELFAYRHQGFWACMDTLREKKHLEECWEGNLAKWKIWK